ncbi:MAG: exo-alpha-sialidase [Verrucomicrobiota bacterium]
MAHQESEITRRLYNLANAIVDQQNARVLIPPQQNGPGFWFGGGNIIQDEDGSLLVCGRYRNYGDSRTGTGAGARGLEFAIFRARSLYDPWEKIKSFTKEQLSLDGVDVVSIEGGCLYQFADIIELYVSTEKNIPYPPRVASYQKPGTGTWSIDCIEAPTIDQLDPVNLRKVLDSQEPAHLHIKDPVVFEIDFGHTALCYANHPYTWSATNTGAHIRRGKNQSFEKMSDEIFPRGPVWDVACTRITERLLVPQRGIFHDLPPIALYFYDGAECLRNMDENEAAVKRPRGYSCEELGGVAWGYDSEFPKMHRLSLDAPLFVSPHGTGCSRYVSTLNTDDGIFATWQQSQPDGSQPLVANLVESQKVNELLT